MKRIPSWPLALLALSACDSTYDFANRIGDHLPVIGDRCENWQCVTESGQQESDMIKQQKLHPAQPPDASAAAPGQAQ